MHYEVNVSHNGSHYFATDARSLRNERDAKTVFDALVARFTEAQGFCPATGYAAKRCRL